MTGSSSSRIKWLFSAPTATLILSSLLAAEETLLPQQRHSLPGVYSCGYRWEEQLVNPYYLTAKESKEMLEKAGIISEFASRLIQNSVELDPAFARVVSNRFWDLI